MTTEYKVWIHVELVNDDEDHYEDATEPRCLYSSSDLEKAKAFVESLTGPEAEMAAAYAVLQVTLADAGDEFGGWS